MKRLLLAVLALCLLGTNGAPPPQTYQTPGYHDDYVIHLRDKQQIHTDELRWTPNMAAIVVQEKDGTIMYIPFPMIDHIEWPYKPPPAYPRGAHP